MLFFFFFTPQKCSVFSLLHLQFMSVLLGVSMSILCPCWALLPLTLGTAITEEARDDKLNNCYRTGSPALQAFPISAHTLSHRSQVPVLTPLPSCVGDDVKARQLQLSVQSLFTALLPNLLRVQSLGSVRGLAGGSDLIRFEKCQDAVCVQMSREPEVNWRKLNAADDCPEKLIF